jgi:hypothetical protein
MRRELAYTNQEGIGESKVSNRRPSSVALRRYTRSYDRRYQYLTKEPYYHYTKADIITDLERPLAIIYSSSIEYR